MSSVPQGAPQTESLPRARIIRRRTVFDATRSQGRRVGNRYLTLGYLPRGAVPSGGTETVAFLTPKRLGPAVVRNKLRRRLREIYRRQVAQSDEPHFLVWIARPPVLELDFDALQETMLALRKRIP